MLLQTSNALPLCILCPWCCVVSVDIFILYVVLTMSSLSCLYRQLRDDIVKTTRVCALHSKNGICSLDN